MNHRRTRLAGLIAGALLLAAPAAAHAGTLTSDGTTATFTGTDAPDSLIVDVNFDGALQITGDVQAGAGCTQVDDRSAQCPLGAGGFDINTRGGDDDVRSIVTAPLPAGAFRASLGDGNDHFGGQAAAETVDGGAGNDKLEGGDGDDTLLGGGGNDQLAGHAGADTLRGGEGDDTLSPDLMGPRYPDVIDGGPGVDSVDDWMPDGDPATAAPASVSLDGVANDGFAGEGDNVTAVENVHASSALVFTGDDQANRATAAEVGGPSVLRGLGGPDILQGGDRADQIDGGAGDDEIQGGYGGDTIVPGPGRDIVVADRPGRCNELHCDISPGAANDTIQARDGEQDSISCGPGEDTVQADAIDVVADDCEHVDRAGGPAPGPGAQRLKLSGKATRAALLHGRLVVLVPCPQACAVKATARAGRRTIATGRAKLAGPGTARVKLRATAAGKRVLRRQGRLTITIAANGSALTVRLK